MPDFDAPIFTKTKVWSLNRYGSVLTEHGEAIYRNVFHVSTTRTIHRTVFILFSGCGKPASARLATLIISGTVVERGQYPWQVAIYMKRNKELICGGTLLNQRVISTGNVI